MKRLLYTGLLIAALTSCSKEDGAEGLSIPSEVSNVTAKPIVGGAVIKWTLPSDSGFNYVEVSYEKKGEIISVPVSKYTDSLVVEGLLNKLEYTFKVKTVNLNSSGKIYGPSELVTEAVRPIRRPNKVVYYSDQLTKVEGVNADMLDTYTQETTEGPKVNLVDGNKNTFWHTAWSSGVANLPHWITLKSENPKKIGAVKYFFRQSTNASGRPTQFALEISNDGATWERVWTSRDGLPIEPYTEEKMVDFGANYEAKFHRLMILKANGTTTYTHLGEIAYYTMHEEVTDAELLAENNY